MGSMQNYTNFKVSKSIRSLKYISFAEFIEIPLKIEEGRHILEIGFGNGEMLTRMARSRRADHFWGIENSEISCIKAAKRAVDFDLQNLMIFHGDAKFLLPELFPNHSLDLVLSFYPLPWPKHSQEGKRLFSKPFFKNVLGLLKEDGKFVIVTDDRGYFEWISQNLKELGVPFFERQIKPLKATKYGRKWNEFGRNSWSLVIKSMNFSTKRMVDGKMPHVHLKEIDLSKLERISNEKFSEDGMVVQFRGLFKGNDEYLLKTVSVDQEFVQIYYIIVKRSQNEWLARLDEGIRVFKTPAVKKSIDIIGRYIGG